MPRNVRFLFAAFIIAAASYAGAESLRGGDHPAKKVNGPTAIVDAAPGLSALRLQNLSLQPAPDERLLDAAFRKVQEVYYKPIAPQSLLEGEQHGLLATLRVHHITADLPSATASGNEQDDIRGLNHTLELAQRQYGQHVGNSELTQGAIRGMLNALGDPYTVYLSAGEINALEESLKGGDFGGIGVYIIQDKAGATLVDPIIGAPASKAGVKPGDVIDAVDGKPVHGMKLDSIEALIRGPIGTTVNLTLHAHGSTAQHRLAVTRQTIHVPSVASKIEDGILYVRLADFGNTSYDEVRRALLEGKEKHVRGYVLDLRNNGGGLLESAVQIASLFIPDGTIVSTIDRQGDREPKEAIHTVVGATPLAVLVNKYTASASEITAGAVQDYHVGRLIGTKTFGKGVVQSIYTMADGGALKITTARYVTPLGRDIQHKGIVPDLVIDQPVDLNHIDTPSDRQLAAAKDYLRHATAKGTE